MKFIIAAFPLATITTAQHCGASLPTMPICIITGISTFITAYFTFNFLHTRFFPDR